ncbi:alpha/beta fold hydrolase [Kribbella deserti]|uniref:Alpha/beta fold hydrolase n=1 Tax=Kribbella deserti TaxID=1926257 RepID=A0ABV6QQY2_9ACTN
MTRARRWIVLPGLAETAEEFAGVIDLLPESYDVQVVDPWLVPVTASVDELRTATGVDGSEPIGLVGHSIGGLAALRWALTRPTEVDRLVLVDTSLADETGHRLLYPGRIGDRLVRRGLRALGHVGLPALVGPVVRGWLLRMSTETDRDPLHRATVRERYGSPGSWVQFWDELSASWPMAVEVARLLESPVIAPPTVQLVGVGPRSARCHLGPQRVLAARLKAALRTLPDSAHLVHLDRPDAIAKAILAP